MTALEFLEKKLAELEAVERAATPGPWHSDVHLNIFGSGKSVAHCWGSDLDGRPIKENTAVVVQSRNNFLPMIRAIRFAIDALCEKDGGSKDLKEMAREMGWREE